ncbi:DUF5103 domain-containing protein [Prolixibacteraceae bacterium JC049]|nr:DUF5103 domain-containing protein [Prolixibacteraceae bacterium JC049]
MNSQNIYRFIYTLSLIIAININTFASDNVFYKNRVFRSNIKTTQLFNSKSNLSYPVIELNSDEQLTLLFDELSDESKDYYYTVKHCTSNWQESFLQPYDYIEGFDNQPIDNFEHSFNTNISYINYQVNIPNDDFQLKISGNYVIIVYENNDMENIVLTQRFSVYQSRISLNTTLKKATFDGANPKNQELDFSILHPDYTITNPHDEISVHVLQNGRSDTERTFNKPQYIREKTLVYDFEKENIYPGENEFRYFNCKNLKIVTENIAQISYHQPYTHFTLQPEEIRSFKDYEYYDELNGKFAIDCRQGNEPRLEADYVWVHFTLYMESPLIGGNIHIFGGLTNWTLSPDTKMTYNIEQRRYEGQLLLKQGYYNYQYAFVNENGITTQNIEGSHYETENDYQIFVYHKSYSERYEQLIGYKLVNTRKGL